MDFEVSFTFQTKLPFALIHTKPIHTSTCLEGHNKESLYPAA